MSFEDFIRDELPLRQVVIKAAGDPTTGDGVIAAIGTYYLDTDDSFKRYEKYGSGNTDWREVVTSSGSGGVTAESVTFDEEKYKITTATVDSLSGTQIVDSFNTNNYTVAKYIVKASDSTSITCSELLLVCTASGVEMTQYGVLGNTSLVSFDADVVSSVASISATTDQTSVDLSIYKFLLG